jgi:Ca-activated chloride channel family protein
MKLGRFVLAAAMAGCAATATQMIDTPPAHAQAGRGSIRGVVTDKRTGEPLAGVTVVASSPALANDQAVITDEHGAYWIDGLPPGAYVVTFYYDDVTIRREGVAVAADKAVAVAMKMDAVATGERIEISDKAPTIDPTATTQGVTIDQEYTKNIPVPGRTFGAALGAAAGSQGDGVGTAFSGSTSLDNQYVVNGVAGGEPPGTEEYARIDDNPFQRVAQAPLSTFSIDVDTASYANARRFLHGGALPPKDAVRIEELVNYFRYDYPTPKDGEPFSVTTEVGPSPWNAQYKLVRIGLATKPIADAKVPPRNLVFLLDVSGSMDEPNKLPLLKQAMNQLVTHLRPEDRVAIVVYAGTEGLALPSTTGDHKDEIRGALAGLDAGGSTNGGAGIELAYKIAQDNFIEHGINRVILCTDGDFNVGVTSEGDLTRLIEGERDHGVFLTVLGFGMGNVKDATMEKLADRGNGNYAYIDSLAEARKVLVKEAGATLVTVAKDVKIQVELNPAKVAGYRLIGYEDRLLRDQDFDDDTKDAGEIGAGHAVTALYEIVPAGVDVPAPAAQKLKYQTPAAGRPGPASPELMTVKIRYKAPDGDKSALLTHAVDDAQHTIRQTSTDFRWAAAVAAFGMMLRESPERGTMTWKLVTNLAKSSIGDDPEGYRRELVSLIAAASKLAPAAAPAQAAR